MHVEEKYEDSSSLKIKTTHGLLWGGVSNGLQQVIGAVFGIVLNRILNPSDYGMIGMITIFSLIASAFQESGFVNGIANKETVSQKDYNAVFWCSISVSTILYMLLFFCAPLIASYYNIPELKSLSRIAFLSFWIGSFGIAHNAYLFRNLMVRERAITLFCALIISNLTGIILAYSGFSYWGIAIQTIIYTATCSSLYFYFSKFNPSLNFDFKPLKEIMGFSSKIFITNIFIHVNNNIYSLILGKYYLPKEVGNVQNSVKWNLMGQSFITNMVSNIAQPVLNELKHDPMRQIRVFRKILSFTSFLAFPVLFGFALVSREFITLALTEKWIDSVPLLKILCIGGAFLVVSNVFSNLILSKGKSQVYMLSVISYGLLQLFILVFTHKTGIIFALQIIALMQIAWLFVWFLLVRPLIKYSFFNLLYDVFTYAFFAAIASIISYFLILPFTDLYLRLLLAVLIMGAFYILLNRLFLPTILNEILTFFKKTIRKPSV